MKITTVLITLSALIFFNSCKKDKNATPAFSAPGFWRGHISTGAVIAIWNNADGASRFYAFLTNLDTATAALKYDGTYTVDEDFFHGHYQYTQDNYHADLSVESMQTTPHYMTGVIVQQETRDTLMGVNALTFEIIKQ